MSDPIFASRGRRTARRARAALLAGLLGAFAGLLLASGTVHADNEVVVSDPADGAVLATAPAAIVITFAEDLGEQNTLSLQCNAELMTIPRADVGEDGRTLSVEIDVPLPKGGCIATWAVGDADNEPNGSGNITFTIENEPTVTETTIEGAVPTTTQDAEAAPATPSATTVTIVVLSLDEVETGKGPVWLGRMLSTLGLAVLFGSLITIAAAWPEGVEYLLAIRFIRSAWIIPSPSNQW